MNFNFIEHTANEEAKKLTPEYLSITRAKSRSSNMRLPAKAAEALSTNTTARGVNNASRCA